MAGRPRTMAMRVAEVEERVYTSYTALEKSRPKQYAARADDDEAMQDELGLLWNVAVEEARETWGYLEELLQLLESGAGTPLLYLDRARSRGLLEVETDGVEGAAVEADRADVDTTPSNPGENVGCVNVNGVNGTDPERVERGAKGAAT